MSDFLDRPSHRYALDIQIGQGGMGEVWKGRSFLAGGLSKTVAIKRLHAAQAKDPASRRQFFAEAKASLGLRHPNIVYVFDFSVVQGRESLVMEWVEGVNLSDLLQGWKARGETAPLAVAIHIAVSVLRALEYAHCRGGCSEGEPSLIHRDVSPQNILVSTLGHVKLSDFGVARIGDTDSSCGGPKGKLAYMAPEQLFHDHDHRVDLYSVGAVLFELFCAERYRARGGDVPALDESANVVKTLVAKGAPRAIAEVVARLLRPRPANRFPSAREAMNALLAEAGHYARSQAEETLSMLATQAHHKARLARECSPEIQSLRKHRIPCYPLAESFLARSVWSETSDPVEPAAAGVESLSRLEGASRPGGLCGPKQGWAHTCKEAMSVGSVFLLLAASALNVPAWFSSTFEPAVRQYERRHGIHPLAFASSLVCSSLRQAQGPIRPSDSANASFDETSSPLSP